jgi:hypothetical protein
MLSLESTCFGRILARLWVFKLLLLKINLMKVLSNIFLFYFVVVFVPDVFLQCALQFYSSIDNRSSYPFDI